MNQYDVEPYTLAMIGHPQNKEVIVMTENGYWRYVETGKRVHPEDFRAGWDLLKAEESSDEPLTNNQRVRLECLDKAKREIMGGDMDAKPTRFGQDEIIDLAKKYAEFVLGD